jgi:hypothetical protein
MTFLVFSGTRSEDLRISVRPGGESLVIEWKVPDFLIDNDRLRYESGGAVAPSDHESTAHRQGVRRLRGQSDENVLFEMVYPTPIQVEEQLAPDAFEFNAWQHTDPNHRGQHIYYLRVHLNGVRSSYNAVSVPAIRVVGPPPIAQAAAQQAPRQQPYPDAAAVPDQQGNGSVPPANNSWSNMMPGFGRR